MDELVEIRKDYIVEGFKDPQGLIINKIQTEKRSKNGHRLNIFIYPGAILTNFAFVDFYTDRKLFKEIALHIWDTYHIVPVLDVFGIVREEGEDLQKEIEDILEAFDYIIKKIESERVEDI